MCGIVGIIKPYGKEASQQEFNGFLSMLAQAETRGRDATGIAYLFTDGTTKVIKAPEKATNVLPYIRYKKGIRAIIGHTRNGTGGVASVNVNNHPFETENWILIHNGMCNTTEDDSNLKLASSCDTEYFVAMFDYIQRKKKLLNTDPVLHMQLPSIIKEGLSKIGGSWSLVFFHKPTGRVFITTNGGSPLHTIRNSELVCFGSVASYFDTANITKKDNEKAFIKEQPKKNLLFEVAPNLSIKLRGMYTPKPYGGYTRTTAITRGGYNEHTVYEGYGMTPPQMNTAPVTVRGYGATDTDRNYNFMDEVNNYSACCAFLAFKSGDIKTPMNENKQLSRKMMKHLRRAYRTTKVYTDTHFIKTITKIKSGKYQTCDQLPKKYKNHVLSVVTSRIVNQLNTSKNKSLIVRGLKTDAIDTDSYLAIHNCLDCFLWHTIFYLYLYGVELFYELPVYATLEEISPELPEISEDINSAFYDVEEDSVIGCAECGVPRIKIERKSYTLHVCTVCDDCFIE